MIKRSVRFLLCALPLLQTACGSRTRLEFASADSACGTPTWTRFHGVRPVLTAPVLPRDVTDHWVNGCAIISFSLDSTGRLLDPIVVEERPEASGVGNLAVAVIRSDIYAPNSEEGFDSAAPGGSDRRFALTIGLKRKGTQTIVSRRTVVKHQTIHVG